MKKNLLCIFITVNLISSTSLFGENNNDVCVELIEQFNTPKITAGMTSPNNKFQLNVQDNGAVTLKNLELDSVVIISPEAGSAMSNCGSIGCRTPEKRALFTPDGRYAITTSAFLGGPTIIWETTNWTSIREKVKNNENVGDGGLIYGGYFRVSPNSQYLAIMRHSWKFGIGLSIVNLDNFTSKIISGMYWTIDVNRVSGLKLNDNEFWLDDFMDVEDYNFSFSNDSKTLIIKKNSNEYILYDVINHSLSSCVSQNQIFLWIKDGKDDGTVTDWYKNGQKKFERTYKDGEYDGLSTKWHENGQKKSEGIYKDGKEDGLGTVWYENGQKKFERTYKDGKQIGKIKRF